MQSDLANYGFFFQFHFCLFQNSPLFLSDYHVFYFCFYNLSNGSPITSGVADIIRLTLKLVHLSTPLYKQYANVAAVASAEAVRPVPTTQSRAASFEVDRQKADRGRPAARLDSAARLELRSMYTFTRLGRAASLMEPRGPSEDAALHPVYAIPENP